MWHEGEYKLSQQDDGKITKTKVSDLHENKIRIATSVPGLKNKIHTQIEPGSDEIYWKIKFNMGLDESSISKKTMNVTDTKGYLLKTEITYKNNTIFLLPKDSYESNQYYLLNISKKVRGENGVKLKREIHVLFKLVDNSIDNFQVLKANVSVPKTKRRPRDYETTHMNSKYIVPRHSKRFSGRSASDVSLQDSQEKVLPMPIKINIVVGVVGLVLSVISILINLSPAVIASMAITFAGLLHIFFQISRKKWRCTLMYNRGVKYFNTDRYDLANVYFLKAQKLDPNNSAVNTAINKIIFHL